MPSTAVVLPPDTETPRRARHFVQTVLKPEQGGVPLDVLALLVSEVVTNAVLHARSDVTLNVKVNGGVVRIEVTDRSQCEPVSPGFSDDALTGRGMLLVEELADAWGTTPCDDGKTVWFELAPAPAG